jgi:hypothetical protein
MSIQQRRGNCGSYEGYILIDLRESMKKGWKHSRILQQKCAAAVMNIPGGRPKNKAFKLPDY